MYKGTYHVDEMLKMTGIKSDMPSKRYASPYAMLCAF
jgi:hypothetical protein